MDRIYILNIRSMASALENFACGFNIPIEEVLRVAVSQMLASVHPSGVEMLAYEDIEALLPVESEGVERLIDIDALTEQIFTMMGLLRQLMEDHLSDELQGKHQQWYVDDIMLERGILSVTLRFAHPQRIEHKLK